MTRAVLLGADCHASVLESSVDRLLASRRAERLRLDAFKLPHHGSRHNLTNALLGKLSSRRYLVSTNGDRFSHPDHEALSRVLLNGGVDPTLFFNYRSKFNERWKNPPPGAPKTRPSTAMGSARSGSREGSHISMRRGIFRRKAPTPRAESAGGEKPHSHNLGHGAACSRLRVKSRVERPMDIQSSHEIRRAPRGSVPNGSDPRAPPIPRSAPPSGWDQRGSRSRRGCIASPRYFTRPRFLSASTSRIHARSITGAGRSKRRRPRSSLAPLYRESD